MTDLEALEVRVMDLEEKLRPIAQGPVDTTQPDWMEKLKAGLPPLDQAGVRQEMEEVLLEFIPAYAAGSEELREKIRHIFAEYRSFEWAATLSIPSDTEEGLRQNLILFSMKDQGLDSRDAILMLQEICCEADAAGVKATSVLQAVAAISSRINKYGMGSTAEMLFSQGQRH